MRVIRPSATTRLTAVWSSPARSIRPAGAPFSHTVPTTASGAIVLKRERMLATRSRPSIGRRTAATSPRVRRRPGGPRGDFHRRYRRTREDLPTPRRHHFRVPGRVRRSQGLFLLGRVADHVANREAKTGHGEGTQLLSAPKGPPLGVAPGRYSRGFGRGVNLYRAGA